MSTACVLVAAAIAGLLFSPVFGFTTLLVPIVCVVVAAFAAAELSRRVPALTAWRPVLVLAAGLLAVIGATVGIPTGSSLGLLVDGAVHGWELTLQSTWPVRPAPRLLVFVPLAVLLAAVFGIELLHRLRPPLLALLPSLVVAGLSQVYVALTGFTAVVTALSFAVIGGVLLAPSGRWVRSLVPAVVLGIVGTVLLTGADPLGRQAYSLRTGQGVSTAPVASPLTGIAYRLQDPETPVFRYTSQSRPDRWPLAVLDSFDGVNWTPGGTVRRMGTELAPDVTVPTTAHTATVETGEETGPWLPSQTWPTTVSGVDPLVDDARGTLFVPGRKGSIQYTINWREPLVDGLAGAAVDPHAPGGFGGIGEIPPGIAELAAQATGGQRPSFQTALALERFLRDNYRVAAGKDLPTGHGWPQLSQFLLRDKRGTSEQFAASYVALARITGIPARLVVGFRAPRDGNVVVRNGDVLAWPEVAVAGAGWIALDPASGAAVGSASVGLAGATAQARAQLPPSGQVRNPELPTDEAGLDEATSGGWDWLAAAQLVGLGLGMLLAGWLLGVPLTTAVRAWRRRRAPGVKAVLGAWAEARDRLRAHGIPVTVGMTVRDLAVSTRTFGSTVDGISALAAAVDAAVWSGTGMTTAMKDQAWAAVRTIRKGLAQRPVSARLRAAIDIRTLIPPR